MREYPLLLRMCQDAGPVRKKVERTTYNEKGEEVTEMVYEDAAAEAEPMLIDEKARDLPHRT